jgi:hypothetical protein
MEHLQIQSEALQTDDELEAYQLAWFHTAGEDLGGVQATELAGLSEAAMGDAVLSEESAQAASVNWVHIVGVPCGA